MPAGRVLAVVAVATLVGLGPQAGEAGAALGPAPLALGASGTFGVLAGSTVTSAGVSAVGGDIGVSPGTAVTGFPPGTLTGTQHLGDPAAAQAHADLATAYTDAVARSPAAPITGDLGGVTLTPGVYAAGAALTLAGTLTLDARGNPSAVFILKAGSTLGTGGRQPGQPHRRRTGVQRLLAGGKLGDARSHVAADRHDRRLDLDHDGRGRDDQWAGARPRRRGDDDPRHRQRGALYHRDSQHRAGDHTIHRTADRP